MKEKNVLVPFDIGIICFIITDFSKKSKRRCKKMSKKYYWLKLKEDFFDKKIIKKLRKIAGGDTYTIIYLKLQLLAMKNDGKLLFEGIEDNFAEEMALELDEDVENVRITLMYLEKNNLIEMLSENEYLLPEVIEATGSESSVTARVRKHRENKKMLQCNTVETKSNKNETTEKEKEKDIEKEKNKKEKTGQTEKLLNYIETLEINSEKKKIFKEWVEYKKNKGQYKDTKSLDILIRRFIKYSVEELRDIVENSIMNNYAGIFEKKGVLKNGNNNYKKISNIENERNTAGYEAEYPNGEW